MTEFITLQGVWLDALNQEKSKPVVAVPTPYPKWNKHCRDEGGGVGLAYGWHITIGGHTGTGKSILGLNMAARAVKAGISVGLISMEMSLQQLSTRFLAIYSGSDIRKLEQGREFDLEVCDSAAANLSHLWLETGAAIHVNDTEIATHDDIVDAIDFLRRDYGVRYFVVDYLQLASEKGCSLLENVTQISNTLRRKAQRERLITVGLSQLNRAHIKDDPVPQHLLGGSRLENDSHQVVVINHKAFERKVMGSAGCLILAKNRHGGTGDIDVFWDHRNLQVREATEEREIDEPPF